MCMALQKCMPVAPPAASRSTFLKSGAVLIGLPTRSTAVALFAIARHGRHIFCPPIILCCWYAASGSDVGFHESKRVYLPSSPLLTVAHKTLLSITYASNQDDASLGTFNTAASNRVSSSSLLLSRDLCEGIGKCGSTLAASQRHGHGGELAVELMRSNVHSMIVTSWM
ncbi:hypothetical protein C8R43DRAFT_559724 [Mycena crocata]|nr:hypothetical protein C8R43DRAFT_559724 [Mycena crocata]